jgi:prepilin-type N-terminal cleavage/methylation domain-containing protein
MKDKGFTLIEMLIVIAVIGVLAIAVLSAINPVEQMRKARDTRRRSNAAELLNALERYYATHEEYPSDYSAAAGDPNDCTTAIASRIASSALVTLVNDNEVKSEFTDRIDDEANFLYSAGDFGASELINVCYVIESRANITKYTGSDIFCTDAGGVHYVCVPE